ncbi:unnamed protein product [Didymodactylos carnosus]|uniref:Riboflavin transporter n=1 Tax=Didymodactylos carnosus TaxID=1234261 RepID=A0A814H418_9BILA|nr:unnamed protein product [Didymodactylos carnosus]CAF1005441.1 unnamed protein product [Didymodactylos carnosus]CAF3613037.1 unnamed protein product [Didymodactylos carnosus]CAF3776776.1 unnamed protein product [Didymodactylos carnosus]
MLLIHVHHLTALGTYTSLSGIWIELPLLVPLLSESWQLPAKLSLVISFASIAPILIVIYRHGRVKNERALEQQQFMVVSLENDKENKTRSIKSEYFLLLCILFLISTLLYGIIPSINSYTLYPHGIKLFHYTVIAGYLSYPLISLIGVFIPEVSTKVIYLLTFIGILIFVYIFLNAKLSPCPLLVDTMSGKVLISFMWVMIILIFSYERVALGNYFCRTHGHNGLLWFGLLTQLGSLLGAMLIYLLTVTFKLFKEQNFCERLSCGKL